MRREEEEGAGIRVQPAARLQAIGNPAITGYFTKVEIPASVDVGARIPLRVGYYANNPTQIYWSTCIMAKMGGTVMIVATTKEIGHEGGGERSYSLFPMPSTTVTIYVGLFGHDDAGHNWTPDDWRETV